MSFYPVFIVFVILRMESKSAIPARLFEIMYCNVIMFKEKKLVFRTNSGIMLKMDKQLLYKEIRI